MLCRRWLPGLFLLIFAGTSFADSQERVTSVIDGNTLMVVNDHQQRSKVQITAVAAPHVGQPYYQPAVAGLSVLTYGRTVTLRNSWRLANGLRLATILVADPACRDAACPHTVDVGLMQIAQGLAWWRRDAAARQTAEERKQYEVAEFQAKAHRRGLWAETNPVPPWLWGGRLRAP